MKSAKNWRNRFNRRAGDEGLRGDKAYSALAAGDLFCLLVAILLFAIAVTTCVLGAGCASTVTPAAIERTANSWDGTNQNSGFIAWTNGGALITAHARDRYNALVKIYGGRFQPPLQADAGIDGTYAANGTYWIDAEHLADFSAMNRWRRGEKP